MLGDINNNGAVTTADRVLLNKWLNGQPTPGLTARNFDLSGNGNLAGAGHTLLNTILDGLPVP